MPNETASSPAPATDPLFDPMSSPAIVALWLVVVLLTMLLPTLVSYAKRDTTHTMENVALVVSQETWLRARENLPIGLVSWNNGVPRVVKPPLVTWLHMLSWTGLDRADPERMIARARLVSIGAGLLLVASTFAIGFGLGGLRLAVIAGLIIGSSFFVERQARTASYDIHVAAWVTCAVAWAVWAIRPLGALPSRKRRWIGWIAVGLATAAAVLSKNPLSYGLVAIPLGSIFVLVPSRRLELVRGGLIALVPAGLIAGAWYVHVALAYPELMEVLRAEFGLSVKAHDEAPAYFYLGLLGLVVPWTPWLIAGLVHPFVPAMRGRRPMRLVPWIWFVMVFVLFSIIAAKQQRYILPIMPAVALLAARVFSDYEALTRRGEPFGSARAVMTIHWGLLLAASLAFGPLLAIQDALSEGVSALGAESGQSPSMIQRAAVFVMPDGAFAGSISWPAAAALTLGLLIVAGLGAALHRRGRWAAAAIMSALWTVLLLGVFWESYGRAPSATHPLRATTEAFARTAAGVPLGSLRLSTERDWYGINEEFRFYCGRLFTAVDEQTLVPFLDASGDRACVLVSTIPEAEAVARSAGLVPGELVQVDKREQRRTWWRGGVVPLGR